MPLKTLYIYIHGLTDRIFNTATKPQKLFYLRVILSTCFSAIFFIFNLPEKVIDFIYMPVTVYIYTYTWIYVYTWYSPSVNSSYSLQVCLLLPDGAWKGIFFRVFNASKFVSGHSLGFAQQYQESKASKHHAWITSDNLRSNKTNPLCGTELTPVRNKDPNLTTCNKIPKEN